jgi:hypothetical protein
MGFWSKLISKNDEDVSFPYIVLLAISAILMLLSIALIIYHCFYHGKGIDDVTVKLILGLLGGGVLNAGASYFRKAITTDFSKTTTSLSEVVATSQTIPPLPVKPGPPSGEGEVL